MTAKEKELFELYKHFFEEVYGIIKDNTASRHPFKYTFIQAKVLVTKCALENIEETGTNNPPVIDLNSFEFRLKC